MLATSVLIGVGAPVPSGLPAPVPVPCVRWVAHRAHVASRSGCTHAGALGSLLRCMLSIFTTFWGLAL